jgi:hypothetical protein
MDEGTDGARVQPGLLECESGGGDADGSGERARVPTATFANAGHQFESSLRESESIIDGSKASFDFF